MTGNGLPSTAIPGQAGAHNSGRSYKRVYKACESCRKTKAKCELEHDAAACVKCQREQRHCVFPLQRSRKRTKVSSPPEDAPVLPTSLDTGQARRDIAVGIDAHLRHTGQEVRREAGLQSSLSDARHAAHTGGRQEESSGAPHNQTGVPPAACDLSANLGTDVVQTFVTSSRDAMGLLFQAAAHDSDESAETDAEATPSNYSRQAGSELSPTTSPRHLSGLLLPAELSQETVELWNKHRFVKQGWFTAYEAISYLEFFFQRLSALSPVAESFHADRNNHKKLVADEPLLCCTILMISARHLSLPGPTGAIRSGFIHSRLWKHIEHLVQRITFGAEKYSTAKSRTLGSIQALLLIIEWHPRSLHFPPEYDGWDASLLSTVDDPYQPQSRKSEATRRWREDVFEPAKRSDRLSWMLVGLATTLAHELAVFDFADGGTSGAEQQALQDTRLRIRRLLYLYTSQLSLRLGCTNLFPQGDQHALSISPNAGISPDEQAHRDRETLLSSWIGITELLTTATHMFFASKSSTKQMLTSYRYLGLLDHFQPLLDKWQTEFVKTPCLTIAEPARQLLWIEYYYVRVVVNSIALQALVERVSRTTPGNIWLDQAVLRKQYAQDFRFINDVRESSGRILVAARKLSDDGHLSYCPVRLFLRIVAASIFLLKAISLGAREADANASLNQLDQCIEALQNNRADDIHLSSRYAELIARHVRRFRRNLRSQGRHHNYRSAAAVEGNAFGPANGISGLGPGQGDPEDSLQIASQVNDSSLVNMPLTDAADVGGPFNFGHSAPSDGIDDWLAQPFDPQVAPFSMEMMQPASGFAIDSLDFLWNMQGL